MYAGVLLLIFYFYRRYPLSPIALRLTAKKGKKSILDSNLLSGLYAYFGNYHDGLSCLSKHLFSA